jgi:hypothetical protein
VREAMIAAVDLGVDLPDQQTVRAATGKRLPARNRAINLGQRDPQAAQGRDAAHRGQRESGLPLPGGTDRKTIGSSVGGQVDARREEVNGNAVWFSTLNALGCRTTVRPGWLSKLLGFSLSLLPRSGRTRVMAAVMRGMTAHME